MRDSPEVEFVRGSMRSDLMFPRLGVVRKVNEHKTPTDRWNFECNVEFRDHRVEPRRVTLATPTRGSIVVPEEDDLVLVQFIEGEAERGVITHVIPNDVDRALVGEAGMIRHKKGKLYEEFLPVDDQTVAQEQYQFGYKEKDDSELFSGAGVTRREVVDGGSSEYFTQPFLKQNGWFAYPFTTEHHSYSDFVDDKGSTKPYVLGRFKLPADKELAVFSAELSDDTESNPPGLKLEVHDLTNSIVEIDLFGQEPGTTKGSGWPSTPPLSVDVSYPSCNQRIVGDPIYTLSYDDGVDRTMELQVNNGSGSVGVSASVSCAVVDPLSDELYNETH